MLKGLFAHSMLLWKRREISENDIFHDLWCFSAVSEASNLDLNTAPREDQHQTSVIS